MHKDTTEKLMYLLPFTFWYFLCYSVGLITIRKKTFSFFLKSEQGAVPSHSLSSHDSALDQKPDLDGTIPN